MKEQNKKKSNILYLLVHISFWGFILGLPVLYFFFGSKIDTENYENRYMAEKPVFSLSTVRTYPTLYENYYNDNFPFRTKLITLNSRISYQLFNEGRGSTIVGKEGWLFYSSEISLDGMNIAQFKGQAVFTDEELQRAAESLEATEKWCAEHGCEFILMITPNKERMYPEFMPDYYMSVRRSDRCNTDQLVDYLRENTDIRVVWAYEDLKEYKDTHPGEPLYYQLDTHWNYLGGYIGARALLRELGIEIPPADERERSLRFPKIGDLTMLMSLGSSDLFSDTDYVFAGYPVESMEKVSDDVNGLLFYKNPGRDHRNVVIYRDSFCNIMRYFIGEQFNNSVMIPRDQWDPEFLNEYHADVLVIEVTERFVDILVNEHIQPLTEEEKAAMGLL